MIGGGLIDAGHPGQGITVPSGPVAATADIQERIAKTVEADGNLILTAYLQKIYS